MTYGRRTGPAQARASAPCCRIGRITSAGCSARLGSVAALPQALPATCYRRLHHPRRRCRACSRCSPGNRVRMARPATPWAHPASANSTNITVSGICQSITSSDCPRSSVPTPDRRSALRMRLKNRPMSIHLEKTDFIIVGNSHAAVAGQTGIAAYGLEPTALLFMLVAAMRARVAEDNIQ
jgi:hypothetical protein